MYDPNAVNLAIDVIRIVAEPLNAENERLRAENERLRRYGDSMREVCSAQAKEIERLDPTRPRAELPTSPHLTASHACTSQITAKTIPRPHSQRWAREGGSGGGIERLAAPHHHGAPIQSQLASANNAMAPASSSSPKRLATLLSSSYKLLTQRCPYPTMRGGRCRPIL
jgi:hypothetical protein